MKRHIPNWLTISRIAVIPVLLALYAYCDTAFRFWALPLFAYAAITDFLDGYLARKWNVLSDLGRMLDPIADKLLVGVLLVVLSAEMPILVIPSACILFRELMVSGMREFMAARDVTVHVTKLAKWKTTLQLVSVGVYLFLMGLGQWPTLDITPLIAIDTAHHMAYGLFWLTALLTLWTGLNYFTGTLRHLRGPTV